MERGLPLNKHDQALLLRNRIVANAFGYDEHFAFTKLDIATFHFDSKMTFENEEKFVFVLVAVPSERALNFGHLDVGVVDFSDNARGPQLGKGGGDLKR